MSRSGGKLVGGKVRWIDSYEKWREQAIFLASHEVVLSEEPWWFGMHWIIESIHEVIGGINVMRVRNKWRDPQREAHYRSAAAVLMDIAGQLEESTWRRVYA